MMYTNFCVLVSRFVGAIEWKLNLMHDGAVRRIRRRWCYVVTSSFFDGESRELAWSLAHGKEIIHRNFHLKGCNTLQTAYPLAI